ncbi:hypothetical protein M3152_08360 [Sporosarcina luteola]|uniref:hypothetical protein n=1 Tax=Sporosarcina luteola TaxID=582850 RepID=UPI00203A4F07|nr:hypothetical protein [Sporosarcina luteola]MCM3637733.1 hypothetical protein [Sporosarcina luteola]
MKGLTEAEQNRANKVYNRLVQLNKKKNYTNAEREEAETLIREARKFLNKSKYGHEKGPLARFFRVL